MPVVRTFGGFRPAASAPTLEAIPGVSISSQVDSDLLIYDATNSNWTNQQLSTLSAIPEFLGLRVAQTAHGFGVMDQIYKSTSGDWVLARANDVGTLCTASVYYTEDADNFVAVLTGKITITGHGFTVGQTYYLSATIAGAVTTTPVDESLYYYQPMFTVLDANTLKVHENIDTTLNTSAMLNTTATNLVIAPNELASWTALFQLTTYGNDGSAPYADAIHFNSGTTGSYGDQNLLMFTKEVGTIGARLFQQTAGSASAYSRYKDFVLTDIGANTVTINNGYLRLYFNGSTSSGIKAVRFNNDPNGPYFNQDTVIQGAAAYVAGNRYDSSGSLPSHRFYFQQDASTTEFARFDENDCYKIGGGYWTAMSDINVKTNIADISDGLEKVIQLQPVEFEYIDTINIKKGRRAGFIAQDVEEVFPENVSTQSDVFDLEGEYKTLKGDFIGYLVAAVQELADKIEAQKETIHQNNEKIDLLKTRYYGISEALDVLEGV